MTHPFRTLVLVAVVLAAVVVAIDLAADMLENYSTRTREAPESTPEPGVPQLRPPREPGRSFIRALLERA